MNNIIEDNSKVKSVKQKQLYLQSEKCISLLIDFDHTQVAAMKAMSDAKWSNSKK